MEASDTAPAPIAMAPATITETATRAVRAVGTTASTILAPASMSSTGAGVGRAGRKGSSATGRITLDQVARDFGSRRACAGHRLAPNGGAEAIVGHRLVSSGIAAIGDRDTPPAGVRQNSEDAPSASASKIAGPERSGRAVATRGRSAAAGREVTGPGSGTADLASDNLAHAGCRSTRIGRAVT